MCLYVRVSVIIHSMDDINLASATTKTPKFTFKGQTMRAKCVSVYDGDTAQFAMMISGELRRMSCRMIGYNCAEMVTHDCIEKAKAEVAASALRDLILNKIVTLIFDDFDKYGRPLVVVHVDGIDVNKYMIDNHIGVVYDGHGDKLW